MTAIQHEIKTACKIIVNSCILLDENSIGKFVKGDGAYLGMTKKDWFPFLPAYYINPARFKGIRDVLNVINVSVYVVL